MSILRIYFSSQWRDSSSVCPWALCDESDAVLQSGMGTLASMPKAAHCVGILSSDRVLFLSARTPPGARRQWRAALPYLVEGRTLPDPDENHVVLCGVPQGGEVPLAITDKAWLRRIVDACRTAALPLRQALSELQLLPHAASQWTLAWNGAGGFVRTGEHAGAALDTSDAETPPAMIRLMLEHPALPRPDQVQVCLMSPASGVEASMPAWADLPVPIAQGEPWDWRWAPIPAAASNLLAGALAPPSRPMEWWPKVRPALVVAVLMLFVEMAGSNIQWALLAHEARALQLEMIVSFRAGFGNDVALVNAPLQMQRNIAELRHGAGVQDSGDFLPLMDIAAAPLAKLPPGSVRELHFEGARLEVVVNAATLQQLDSLQQSLRNAGLQVRMETSGSGNGFGAKLTLRPQGAI